MLTNIDGEMLRMAMRQVPSAVTVVTVAEEDEMRGITIGSLTSVSLDPPLISFNVGYEAQSHDILVHAERFAVHVLSDEQGYLSEHFAIPDRTSEEQFGTIAYRIDPYGTPILEDVLAVFHCAHYTVYPAGDHSLLLGEVLAIEKGAEGTPLVYFNRSYRSVGGEVDSNVVVPVKRVSNPSP